VTHPLSWVKLAQDRGYDVLLDAAAYLPTSDLDLSDIKPEFVIVSWYKLFGFPTGVGSLVVRRDALATLHRPWFSGGTVQAALVGAQWYKLNDDETAFEDGTLNFLSIPDVHVGIDWLVQLGREATAARVRWLTERFIRSLHALRHTNDRPMAVIYGPTGMEGRGGTVAFNLLDAEGHIIDGEIVARDAAAAKISIRTGCFCNPGAGEAALGIQKTQIKAFFDRRPVAADGRTHHKPLAGAIRASFGVASIEEDGDALIQLIQTVYKDWLPLHKKT
jgi:selenocysteine lyase/cysteine desulfurase